VLGVGVGGDVGTMRADEGQVRDNRGGQEHRNRRVPQRDSPPWRPVHCRRKCGIKKEGAKILVCRGGRAKLHERGKNYTRGGKTTESGRRGGLASANVLQEVYCHFCNFVFGL
jgi:hypothetical protein